MGWQPMPLEPTGWQPVPRQGKRGFQAKDVSLNKILVRGSKFERCFFRQNEQNDEEWTEWVSVILLINSILFILSKNYRLKKR